MQSIAHPAHQFLVAAALLSVTNSPLAETGDYRHNPWWTSGQQALQTRLAVRPDNNPARNVIVFIGDGMGISTITAGRIFDGQSRGNPGEENRLPFEDFPYLALIKTYTTNQQVPDSAGTASAIHSGVKTRAGVLGISEHARRGNCAESLANQVPVVGEIARARGMATGIVSTTSITHATPASVYAHSPERDWEADSDLPELAREEGCIDIARQLIEFLSGGDIDVVLGGGARNFVPSTKGGRRTAGNLIEQWQERGGFFVDSIDSLRAIDPGTSGPLLGLFSDSHMTYMADRNPDSDEPTLTEMTEAAIRRLATHNRGYYLMVEGGRIDHAHHEGIAGKALLETQEFARAVDKAVSMVDLGETLIMVTADHSHVFTIAGYPSRGNPILDLVRGNDHSGEPTNTPSLALDNRPYTTLSYANGPGAVTGERSTPVTGIEAQQQAAVPTGYMMDSYEIMAETHGGEDVALFAIGPKSHLVGGVMEQHVIFHIIRHALGWDAADQLSAGGTLTAPDVPPVSSVSP